jgi:hypothetical protein
VNRYDTVQLVATPLEAELSSGLAPIDFADCYHGQTTRQGLSALQVAHAMFTQPPGWVNALMAARNGIVRHFGLKTPDSAPQGRPRVGIFPLISEQPGQVVLGLDDKHLDFRIWVSVRASASGSDVWMSTLVRFNGVSGRFYLFLIMPFHKLLSRYMLGRAIRSLNS